MDTYLNKIRSICGQHWFKNQMLVHGWWSITYVLNVCTTCSNWVVDLPSIFHTSNCLETNCFSALMMFCVIGMNNETSINMWLNSLALEKKERKKELLQQQQLFMQSINAGHGKHAAGIEPHICLLYSELAAGRDSDN